MELIHNHPHEQDTVIDRAWGGSRVEGGSGGLRSKSRALINDVNHQLRKLS